MPEQAGQVSFVVRLYGDQAQQDALNIRKMLEEQLAAAEKQLAQSTQSSNKAITSQTRRLGSNLKRLEEVTNYVNQLGKTWREIVLGMGQSGEDAFDPLVASGQEAYNKLVGGSILTDLMHRYFGIIDQMMEAGVNVFQPLQQSAQQASQQVITQIEGVVDAMGRMRWPAGTQLEGFQLGGRWTSPEQVDAFNRGALRASDIMSGVQQDSDDVTASMERQGKAVAKGGGMWQDFTDRLNAATLQFFGLRRLGYGLEQFGNQLASAGERSIQTLTSWAKMYGEFNEYATRAAAAMEMTAEQQQMLEDTVLANVDAMRLFTPEEIIDGLRAWAAGTGAVVQTQSELNEVIEQTNSVQVLASLGGAQLEDTMRNVGGTMAEYGMAIQEVERITAIYNFTAAKTFAEVEDIGDAFRLVGPLAHSLGISVEETAAALGLLADQNIKGTMAGRAFRQMLIQLVKPTKEHNDAMNQALGMSGQLGDSWRDLVFPSGKFIGLAQYIDILAAATENMTVEQRNNRLATIATANELPSLVALVTAQTEARKDGINVMRAWTKWSVGIYDEEVAAFKDYMQRTRGIAIDETTDMYSLWEEQSELFYESEAAKLMRYEQRWRTTQIRLGEIVLDKSGKNIDRLLDLLEKVAEFAEAHPQLVGAAIYAAGAELVLGNLIRFAGQMVGITANWLIMTKAFGGFAGAVGMFTAAVTRFSAAAGVEAAGSGALAAGGLGAGATIAGVLGPALAGLLGGSLTAQALTGKNLFDLFNISKERSEVAIEAEKRYSKLNEGNAKRRLAFLQAEARDLEKWQAAKLFGFETWKDVPERYMAGGMPSGKLLEERQVQVGEMIAALERRLAELGADISVDSIDPILKELLAGQDIFLGVTVGFTTEQIEAVELFDKMNEDMEAKTEDYAKRRQDIINDFNERELEREEDYLARREDTIESYQDKEASNLRKHLDKLAGYEVDYRKRIADADEALNEKLDQIQRKAAEREEDIRADTHKRKEDAEEDHLKKLQRMQEDHAVTLFDLAVKRDAYGIFKEMRDYKTKRSREIDDYRDRQRDIDESAEERLADARKQSTQEEADARASHAEKLADTDEWLAEQIKKEKKSYEDSSRERAKAHAKTLKELDEQYEKQRKRRLKAHLTELRDLEDKHHEELQEIHEAMSLELATLLGYYTQGTADYRGYLQDRLDELERYLNANRHLWEQEQPPPVIPPRTPGGPTPWPGGAEGLFDPAGLPSRTVVVDGNFAINITADRNAARVGVPVAAMEEEMVKVFDSVRRRLEVSYV